MRPPSLAAALALALALALAFAPAAGVSAGEAADAPKRPTAIVFVLADDLGWAELGCYGNRFNETPQLDRLARQGVRFTDAYAAAPVCSPYRASLMTGQWPARVGITDYLRPNDPKHLSTAQVTLAEMFRAAGYATGLVGKWHLTGYANHGAKEVPPSEHGFQETIVSENRGIGGGSYWYPYHFNREVEKRLPLAGGEGREYLVDRINLEAVEFIERHRSEPFFLYVSHYAVHTRLDGKPELVAHYHAKPGAGEGIHAPRNNCHLAAMLEGIDEGVGRIVEKLEAIGRSRDSIVIFTGDNGGEDRVTTNGPLRAGKSTLYEGGIRVPLVVRWPGRVPAGAVCPTPVSSVDFYPTLAAAIGEKIDPAQKIDGVSILPLLEDPAARIEREALFWHYPILRPHFLGGRSGGAVRAGAWKLLEDYTSGRVELYRLDEDISEAHDLAASRPEKARELRERLASWRASVGARVVKHAPRRKRRGR